eukprot:g30861.t1
MIIINADVRASIKQLQLAAWTSILDVQHQQVRACSMDSNCMRTPAQQDLQVPVGKMGCQFLSVCPVQGKYIKPVQPIHNGCTVLAPGIPGGTRLACSSSNVKCEATMSRDMVDKQIWHVCDGKIRVLRKGHRTRNINSNFFFTDAARPAELFQQLLPLFLIYSICSS